MANILGVLRLSGYFDVGEIAALKIMVCSLPPHALDASRHGVELVKE